MTQNKNIDWIKKIDKAFANIDEKPLLKSPKPFDWQAFSDHISEECQIKDIQISAINTMWRNNEEIIDGLGENSNKLGIIATPVSDKAYWIMAEEDISKLTSLMATQKKNNHFTMSEILQEGFYRYLTLEVLKNIEDMNTFEGISLKISDKEEMTIEESLCMDIMITIKNQTCWGRLVLPQNFRQSWNTFFANSPSLYEKEINKNVEVSLRLEAGYSTIDSKTLDEIQVGDFLLLDSSPLSPVTKKGSVTIVLGNTPLFHAKVKKNNIKLIDYAYYYDKGEVMTNEEENKWEEEIEIPPEIHEEIEEAPLTIIEEQEETPIEPEEQFEEEFIPEPMPEEKLTSIKELPLTIVVEVGRMSMTVEKLSQLQPGNVIELPVHPEQGVDLTINGKKIGRADLVHLGEAVGVRINEIEK